MTHRAKLLGQARADLTQLPAMLDELARCLTERAAAGAGKPSKVSGSPAPLRLDVLHLVDERRKPGWDGEDPRLRQLEDRYGATATLESWTRIVCEELREDRPEMADVPTVRSEASVLIEVWDWIQDQEWAEELAQDVIDLGKRVRAALGYLKEPQFVCVTCGARAYLRYGDGFLVCEEGHETSVRNLEEQQRRRPALPIDDITAEFGITKERIYSWHKRKQIKPMEGSKPLTWFPWDVILLTNPALAEAIKAREAMSA